MSGLDEQSILNNAIIDQHAYRMHLASKGSIDYELAQVMVKNLTDEYDLANGINTGAGQLTIPDVSNLLAFLAWYRQHPELHDWSIDIVLKEYQKANCG